MKTALLLFLAAMTFGFAADPLTEKLQRGLFEEEANRNLPAAIKEYEALVAAADEQRKLVATALFRLGESYRKLGKTNEARAFYERIVRDYSEQEQLVKLSRNYIRDEAQFPRPGDDQIDRLRDEMAAQAATYQRLAQLSREELLRMLPQFQDSTGLQELQTQLRAAEQKRTTLRASGLGDTHPEVRAVTALTNTINTQIDEVIKSTLAGMKLKIEMLEERLASSGAQASKSSAASATANLLTQAEAEELARVKALAQNSPDLLNAPYKEGLTPLQYAAREGFPTVLDFILAQGVNVNGPDRGTPPLVLAAERGHLRIVELLLNRGADVNAAGTSGKTALIAAVEKNFRAVADLLLARGADVNRGITGISTALHAAVRQGSSNFVALLLHRGANPNVLVRGDRWPPQPHVEPRQSDYERFNGFTPLHLAASRGFVNIADMLLDAGAAPNATNWGGATPLHVAVGASTTNVVRFLLSQGANVNVRDDAGTTPLALAIQQSADKTELLLAGGAKVNEPAYDRPDFIAYPIHLAASKQESEVLRALLRARPNLEVTNLQGYTPLWGTLVAQGTDTNVAMLVEAGADVRRTLGNRSPIQHAVQNETAEVARLLLKAGADVNQRDEAGNTLLHYAVGRTPDMVRALLEHGANPNVFNREMQTPLSIALSPNRSSRAGASRRQLPPVAIAEDPGGGARANAGSESDAIVALLKEHGADEFMQRRLQISARRGEQTYPIFTRGTNVLNRFTLMEFLGAVYKNGGVAHPGQLFPWPDFSNLRIQRLNGTDQIFLSANLADALETGDCNQDQWLEWGDIVEVPERVHPLNIGWGALPLAEVTTLTNCVARTVQVSVGGTNISARLKPVIRWPGAPDLGVEGYVFAYLSTVLRNEREVNRHLRSSSDLSRVKVRRTDAPTKEMRTMVFDLTGFVFAGKGGRLDETLWLRDGDVIEIPEKR